MVLKNITQIFKIVTCLLLLSGCQKPAGGGDSSSSNETTSRDSFSNAGELPTDCGVVVDGKVQNPVDLGDGQAVTVTDILSNNLLVVETSGKNGAGGKQLVKLQGIASAPAGRGDAAMALLQSLSRYNTTFFPASKDCTITLDGGGQGTIGQLFSSSGESFAEALVKADLSNVDSQDACGGDKIAGCLSALKGTEATPLGEAERFLWKPLSDTKGNVMVMHELHCGATAIVNGETLEYRGSGNGRCGTYVGRKPGCAYGSNIRVQIIDKFSGRPYTHNGQPFIIVPNGCQRFEF